MSKVLVYNGFMSIESILSGGNPRTFGKTDEVVSDVLKNHSKLKELFECLYSDDEIVRMRAGDALEKICRQEPKWFDPYIERLLQEVSKIDQPSVQWHLAQILGGLQLSQSQKSRAVEILKRNIESSTDWIVLNNSLEVFAQFARDDTKLLPYFMGQLSRHSNSRHKSVAKRAGKLLAAFD